MQETLLGIIRSRLIFYGDRPRPTYAEILWLQRLAALLLGSFWCQVQTFEKTQKLIVYQ